MLAVSLVVGAVLVELGLVYGVGKFCFLWWDGSLSRRILLTALAIAVGLAVNWYLDTHLIEII